MERLMNDLLRHLTLQMNGLVAVTDEDCGQLDALKNGEAAYALAFPCVLIGVPQADWGVVGGGTERGRLTLNVRLAVECPLPAARQNEALESCRERYLLMRRLHEALQGWCFEGGASAAVRTRSQEWALPGNVKVYELQYSVTVLQAGQNKVS